MNKLLIILITIGLFACTNSSEYRTPAVKINAQFPSANTTHKPINHLPYTAWWTGFNDPLLTKYIELSLNCNPDVPIAIANLESAQAELRQIKLGWVPNLILQGGYSTNPALGVPAGFYGVLPTYFINIAKQWNQQKQAAFNVKYYQAMQDGVRLIVIGQTAAAYFTLIAMREELKLLNNLKHHLDELVRLFKSDIQIGLKNDIDLTPFIVEQQLASAEIQSIKNNIVLSENALRYLLGKNPGHLPSVNHFSQIDFNHFNPGSLPATVLHQRPDVRMAAFALKRARAGIDLAYSSFFPNLQLDQFVGDVHKNKFANVTDAYAVESLSPAAIGNIAVKQSDYKATLFNYTKTIKKVLIAVDNDFSSHSYFTRRFNDINSAKIAYNHEYQLQQGLLKIGLIANLDLLSNQVELDRLALVTNQAKLQVALSLVTLYQDLAGGYKVHQHTRH
jgi:multidrug efflux system outer membrane protein